MPSELSRRRIRSVNKQVRVGRNESVVVIRVDKDKGLDVFDVFANVFISQVPLICPNGVCMQRICCNARTALRRRKPSILYCVMWPINWVRARNLLSKIPCLSGYDDDAQLEDLYDRTAWHFDRQAKRKAASYDMFKKAIQDPSVLDECDISADVKEKLLEDIRKRLTPSAVKIRADIEVSCFGYEGINAVKNALREVLKPDELPIKVGAWHTKVCGAL